MPQEFEFSQDFQKVPYTFETALMKYPETKGLISIVCSAAIFFSAKRIWRAAK